MSRRHESSVSRRDNVLHNGALRELMLDQGEHRTGVIVKDNPGRVFEPA